MSENTEKSVSIPQIFILGIYHFGKGGDHVRILKELITNYSSLKLIDPFQYI